MFSWNSEGCVWCFTSRDRGINDTFIYNQGLEFHKIKGKTFKIPYISKL